MTEFIDRTKSRNIREIKKTVFVKIVLPRVVDAGLEEVSFQPERYHHVELIRKNTCSGFFDYMLAYDSKGDKQPMLYLGHWNDGC